MRSRSLSVGQMEGGGLSARPPLLCAVSDLGTSRRRSHENHHRSRPGRWIVVNTNDFKKAYWVSRRYADVLNLIEIVNMSSNPIDPGKVRVYVGEPGSLGPCYYAYIDKD